jgi:heat shock protein HslJ
MKSIMFVVTLLLILTACNSPKKIGESSAPELTETYWKLSELMGKPITGPSATGKEMYIKLIKEGNMVQGHGGCNSFRGKYEIKDGNRISFSGLASTMMACPDMENESAFMKAVESADNYVISGNSLQLNKAKMAPLAKFEAVKK